MYPGNADHDTASVRGMPATSSTSRALLLATNSGGGGDKSAEVAGQYRKEKKTFQKMSFQIQHQRKFPFSHLLLHFPAPKLSIWKFSPISEACPIRMLGFSEFRRHDFEVQ